VSGLVAALVGLAALFAERATVQARSARVRERVVHEREPARRRTIEPRVLAAFIGAALVGAALFGPGGAAAGPAIVGSSRWLLSVRRRRARAGLLDEQLADAVQALAAAMRAGQSVPQAMAYVAREAEAPLAPHLDELVEALGVGRPLSEALAVWADRVGTDDARLVASALDLHRRAGGDLPRVLEQVARTIRDRVAAAREVRALTAQARLSGLILGLLPVGFFAFLWVTSRRDMQAALATPAGVIAVILGLAMEGAAFVWIKKLLAVTA
jgi:tight adherence protein B